VKYVVLFIFLKCMQISFFFDGGVVQSLKTYSKRKLPLNVERWKILESHNQGGIKEKQKTKETSRRCK